MAIDLEGIPYGPVVARRRFRFQGKTYEPGEAVPIGVPNRGTLAKKLLGAGHVVYRESAIGKRLQELHPKGKK